MERQGGCFSELLDLERPRQEEALLHTAQGARGGGRWSSRELERDGYDFGGLSGPGARHKPQGKSVIKMGEVIRDEEPIQPPGRAQLKAPVYRIPRFTFKAVERLDRGQKRAIKSIWGEKNM